MGVANSKRKYSGGPNYSTKRGSDAEDGKAEEGKAEETPAETDPDKIKLANMKMWGPVLKAFMDNKQVKMKIKQAADKQSAEGSEFTSKKILFSADDAQAYVSGKESHPLTQYFIDDLDKIYLFNPEFKKILEDLSKGSEGQPERKMIKVPKDDKDTLTKLIPMILDGPTHVLENVKRAVQHKALTEIINYVLASKEFKDHHKGTLTEQRDAIKSGDKSKEEASHDLKEKKGDGDAPAEGTSEGGEGAEQGSVPPSAIEIASTIAKALAETKIVPADTLSIVSEANLEGGSDSSSMTDSYGGSDTSSMTDSYGGSDSSSVSRIADSIIDSEGGSELDSISSTNSTDPLTGGKFFKTAEEKEDKKFKKAEQAGLEEKKKAFVLDTVKMVKFMDENKDTLLALYSKSTKKSLGLGSNIDKNADKTAAVEALFPVVDAYVKEPDMAGAAGVPPPAEGDKKDGAEKKTDGAEKKADGAPDGASDGADKKEDGVEKKADGAKDDKANTADVNAKNPPLSGGNDATTGIETPIIQGGGGKVVPKKKKKFTRKKPQHIKISINVGNKNVIASDSSESDSSESDSSESDSSESDSSESDSSESDGEERKQKYVVNKNKKHSISLA